ncbi:hypothetical protein QTP88_004042 [Uroleucon formosanum]
MAVSSANVARCVLFECGMSERTANVRCDKNDFNVRYKEAGRNVLIYKQLFEIVTPLSKMLQTVDIDLIGVIAVVDDKTRELKNARSDVHFLKLQEKVNLFKMSTSMDIEDFKPLPLNRSKRVPKRSAEETQDEVITDPLQNFKIQTFFVAYDTAIIQIKERFSEIAKGIYKDLSLFSRRRLEEISKNNDLLPKDAFDVFSDVYSKFIQKDDLKREYLQFSESYFNFEQVKLLPLQLHKSKIEIDDDLSSSLTDEASESETEDSFENNDNKQVKEVPKLHKNGCSLSIVLKVLLISGLSSTFPPNAYYCLKNCCYSPSGQYYSRENILKIKYCEKQVTQHYGRRKT